MAGSQARATCHVQMTPNVRATSLHQALRPAIRHLASGQTADWRSGSALHPVQRIVVGRKHIDLVESSGAATLTTPKPQPRREPNEWFGRIHRAIRNERERMTSGPVPVFVCLGYAQQPTNKPAAHQAAYVTAYPVVTLAPGRDRRMPLLG